jgi:hypothetical protein
LTAWMTSLTSERTIASPTTMRRRMKRFRTALLYPNHTRDARYTRGRQLVHPRPFMQRKCFPATGRRPRLGSRYFLRLLRLSRFFASGFV